MAQSLSMVLRHIVFSTHNRQKTIPEHHRLNSFKEELLVLWEKYGVAYDEKYLWD
jgi:hypothetical protein